ELELVIAAGYYKGHFPRLDLFQRCLETKENVRSCYREIVRWQEQMHVRHEFHQSTHRTRVDRKVSFGSEQVDRTRIVSVAHEEQTLLAVEEHDGIRRVPRC